MRSTDALRDEWDVLNRRLEALDASIMARARRVAGAAGLDPSCPLQWHNAQVGLEYGTPWREVNYSLCRQALYLSNEYRSRIWRLRDRLWNMTWRRHFPERAS